VAAAGLALPAMAQKEAVKEQPPSKAVPTEGVKPGPYTPTITTRDGKLTFTATEMDFGTIDDEGVKEHAFTFTNTGSGPLEITETHGSCGCTVGTLEKRVYQPGESGSIKVSFNPAHKRDQQHTTVTVSSNDASAPQVVLNIKAMVKPRVMVEPTVAMLNQIAKGRGGSTKVLVSSRVPGLKLLSATPTVAYFDARIGPERQVEVNGEMLTQWDLEIITRPDAPVGPVNGVVSIRTSDEKRQPMNVTATGEVVGDVAVTPQRVQLVNLTPGQAINAQFTVRARNGVPFKLVRIDEVPSGPNSSAKVFSKIDIKEDASTTPVSYIVNLSGTASEDARQIAGQLIVRTDVKGEEETRVPYFGYVRVQPKAITPTKPTVWEENPSSLIPGGPR
jgi:hypothetical protein